MTTERRLVELDGLVHHWDQGPADVTRLTTTRWQYRWWLENVGELDRDQVANALHFILADVSQGWKQAGVQFVQVPNMDWAHVLVRFTPISGPPGSSNPSGRFYYDFGLQKWVVHVAPSVFGVTRDLAYVVNMEFGHAVFHMYDMYTPEHEPYVGVMGGWPAAAISDGFPTPQEIECAQAWLRGEAMHVHPH